MVLNAALLLFMVLEASNIVMLYFVPSTTKGNAMGVFKDYIEAERDADSTLLLHYMVNWVAGSKLIFVALLTVILIWGSPTVKIAALVVLIASIATFYWRLYPLILTLDQRGRLRPQGYARQLLWMIHGFIALFSLALIWVLVT